MKLIILAAGNGTRFLPATNKIPKGMIPILGEPLLKHVVEPYLENVTDVIFVVNDQLGMQIKKYFKENYRGHNVFYRIQKEQKGTMDALMTCKDLIKKGELFCICNGDDLLMESEIRNAIQKKSIGLGVSIKIMPKGYLGIEIENENILGFTRHDTAEKYVEDVFFNGFGIFDNRVFDFLPISTRDGELGLPHTLFENLDTYPLRAFTFKFWETVNCQEDIKSAEKFIKGL
ncbi:MAG: NTP transferase domain-containing protein [Patescibacteria group bacterium]|nr:NTP transferase domain-containing protein [Patescibacteria group bacterium]